MASNQSGPAELEAEGFYSKAASAELGCDWDQAFRLYIKAAECFLHLSRTTTSEKIRTRCKSHAGRALERAEKIKATKRDLAPVMINHFSDAEQFRILKMSSQVNNLRFQLWNEPAPDFRSTSVYQDPDGQPNFSLEQSNISPVWRRAIEAIPQASMISPLLLPDAIFQQIVTDCSVCASFSVCLEHHRRFGSKLGLSSLHPQDTMNIPILSQTGRYDLRLFFNGGHRRIVIDDNLPFHPDGSLLCMSTRFKPHLWPSLVEKAYMKLMGGYNFPGSNSCIDLHALTGWIPEHIEIKSPTFERERTWYRIASGFFKGHCVLTVGTGQGAAIRWRGVDLPASHCFAVIDVREVKEECHLTVLGSWTSPSIEDNADAAPSQQRVFDMSWGDICDVFDGIYLNWNPNLFKNQLSFHGLWLPKNVQEDDGQSSNRHLQLKIHNSSVDKTLQNVWILLTRHMTDTRRTSEYIALQVRTDDHASTSADLNKIALRGSYSNSPHILVRTSVSQTSGTQSSSSSRTSPSFSALSIFASYDGPSEDVGFTITAFSSCEMSWNETISKAPYISKIDGALTSKNGGGNCSYPTFMVNPQYHLHIRPEKQKQPFPDWIRSDLKARVVLAVQGSKSIPLNVMVVWSQGQRIVELAEKEIVVNSGTYSYGFARVSAELPVGDYTVIVSAFEPHHMGSFSVRVESSSGFDFKAISQEGAGMYSKTIRGAWNEHTAMGGPAFNGYSRNPIFEIETPSLTELKVRLQLIRPAASIPLNVSLFRPSNDGLMGELMVTSGPYSDAVSGVAIPQVTLKPGKYHLLPSTYNPGVQTEFRLIVYHTTAGVNVVAQRIEQ